MTSGVYIRTPENIAAMRVRMLGKPSHRKYKLADLEGNCLLFAEKYGIDEWAKAKNKHDTQKWHATINRKLEWLFTVDEWFKVWLDSDKWSERGTKKGQYCMCRHNDTGAYSINNIRIDLHGQNTREANMGNTYGSAHKGKSNDQRRKKTK